MSSTEPREISDGTPPTAPVDADLQGAACESDHARLRSENAQLHRAMDSRAVIEQARGMLMALGPCSGESAWLLLVEISQHSNVKLRDVAVALVATTGGLPLPAEIRPAVRHGLARLRGTPSRG